jgi:hypothetical protein
MSAGAVVSQEDGEHVGEHHTCVDETGQGRFNPLILIEYRRHD